MTDKRDPGAAFQQMLTDWERSTNALANQLMGTGEFSRTINGVTNLSLALQQQIQEHMSRVLATVNLPSREEVAELGVTLRQVDERLSRIEALLAGLGGAGAQTSAPDRPRPPRTRKPPQKAH